MRGFCEDIVQQINLVSKTTYKVLLLFLVIGAAILWAYYGKRALQYISRMLFVEYLFFIYCLTVFFRIASTRYTHIYIPFESYKSLLKGEIPPLFNEMLLNVMLFIPVGLLLAPQVSKRTARNQWLIALLLGLGLSLSIELLQLAFQKGSFETDDIIHNTLGCLIGFAIWRGCAKLIVAIKSHNGNNRQETT